MAVEMVTRQTVITPQLATAASMLVRIGHAGDQSLHRALAKAEERLISQPWRLDDGILRIVSFSRQNEAHRTDGDYCECQTKRGICWHRAAWLILSTLAAAGICAVADLPLPSVLDDDELPGDFLDSVPAFPDEPAYDDEPFAPAFSFRAVDHTPAAGSDFARAQALADEMFAA